MRRECQYVEAGDHYVCRVCGDPRPRKVRRICRDDGEPVPDPQEIEELRSVLRDPPKWVTNQERVAAVHDLAKQIPSKVTAVAGVPRSGMAPAGMLAELLHLPLYQIHQNSGLIKLDHGTRFDKDEENGLMLVVDDTVCTGRSLRDLRPTLQSLGREHLVAVVFKNPIGKGCTDFVGRYLPSPHYLEWNFFNSGYAARMAVDFDGVLTHDGTHRPQYLPRRFPVPLVCSCRMERHRKSSSRWLDKHGVRYKRLALWPGGDEERWVDHGCARWKGEQFLESDAAIFVESCPIQAKVIAEVSKKRVICPQTAEVHN